MSKYNNRYAAEGLCVNCGGQKDGDYKNLCVECARKRREYARGRGNYKAWRPGGAGKRPLSEG